MIEKIVERAIARLKLARHGIFRTKVKLGDMVIKVPPEVLVRAIEAVSQESELKYSKWAVNLAKAYCPPGDEECVEKMAEYLSRRICEHFKLD